MRRSLVVCRRALVFMLAFVYHEGAVAVGESGPTWMTAGIHRSNPMDLSNGILVIVISWHALAEVFGFIRDVSNRSKLKINPSIPARRARFNEDGNTYQATRHEPCERLAAVVASVQIGVATIRYRKKCRSMQSHVNE